MAKTGLIDKLDKRLLEERTAISDVAGSDEAKILAQAHKHLASSLREIGTTNDIDLILQAEHSILRDDLLHHVTSRSMQSSLERALTEHDLNTKELLPRVRDPAAYGEIDIGHSLPKNRLGEVPNDEARQFFRSHLTRLDNMDKARLDRHEKAVIHERKTNIRIAERIYTRLQKEALGLSETQSLKQSEGLSQKL